MDQDAAWADGDDVDPVVIRARLPGSTVEVDATVLGPPPGASLAAMAARQDVPAGGPACWTIRDVEVRFLRRGVWRASTFSSRSAAASSAKRLATSGWALCHLRSG
jgi:hypothetical protein